jgi:secreted trypsin-like serine protease
MLRHWIVSITALLLVGLTALPAAAVTDGVPDGDAHRYVGLVVFYDAEGTPTHRCTGTLIAPDVLLTAGHCTEGAASAQVWFDSEVTRSSGYPYTGGITGTPVTHPDYDDFATFPNTSDLGLVYLDKRVRLSEYGAIAALGTLDDLATERGQQEVTFTVVGYGLQAVKPKLTAQTTRYQGTVQLVNLSSALTDGYNLHHTNAKGTGGGTCFGESGGPVFYGDTNVIVAVTSFGLNENCAGAGFAYRVDIKNAQNFIYS